MGKFCWLQVTIGGKPLREKIVLELFDDVTPLTCANFRALCTGNEGKVVEGTDTPMTYKGSTFHRIIGGFMIQGGDFTKHNGTGGVSIYGERFDDENFDMPCDKAGLLAMANAGPNTNGSQFFITVNPAHHLTGRHVVFGKVVRGMNTVRALEYVETGANDTPLQPCVIADCGVMESLPDPVEQVGGDKYPDYPEDCSPALSDAELVRAGEEIRQIGNNLFKGGDYENAMEKYAKVTRYLKAVNKTSANEGTINEMLIACHNNAAASAVKLSRWSDARNAATRVLDIDGSNVKALFRRGTACLGSGDPESAIADLSKAKALDPQNTEVAAKLQQAKEAEKARTAKLASGLKKMFS
ncbi:peptidyl-prolyl cis-trans isomerase (cyclophilin-40), putative [Trypanosoma equiperdum]|uniref:peptidylprolyl isomerase n=3 Tax=Trypanozoon TaxID=39700 RepID=Q38E20_TRYB2|nr:cyclophilin-40, putative [Trypanosoma brucei gambiense DAL972]XP_827280.1 peptidyl-prolyl cis-trans isomerase (cyclophilin- 40), putative [Trypanosoma brucei brucei TREU927]EAN76950.1 peptidyl-prolyl cis-trans isomerase (cyclophilin- 40), putative [Trypanosoma brucei brucei TREU927]CBH14487.1 cyclophilin-40, putative [Trypanosoma brucei gambiense DAL972]SCU72467.1 peptidyl-prolyl cis-trans isomerase (cyclophilin-40), putative [Trypanosoma equiperdum]|eukprot:XP_011776753.1 cyclophilin-40, putative [Trypanosoma brucei gambiense DAL972]